MGDRNKNREQEQRTKKEQAWFNVFYQMYSKSQKEQRKFTLFCSQMGPKNKTSFVQKEQ